MTVFRRSSISLRRPGVTYLAVLSKSDTAVQANIFTTKSTRAQLPIFSPGGSVNSRIPLNSLKIHKNDGIISWPTRRGIPVEFGCPQCCRSEVSVLLHNGWRYSRRIDDIVVLGLTTIRAYQRGRSALAVHRAFAHHPRRRNSAGAGVAYTERFGLFVEQTVRTK